MCPSTRCVSMQRLRASRVQPSCGEWATPTMPVRTPTVAAHLGRGPARSAVGAGLPPIAPVATACFPGRGRAGSHAPASETFAVLSNPPTQGIPWARSRLRGGERSPLATCFVAPTNPSPPLPRPVKPEVAGSSPVTPATLRCGSLRQPARRCAFTATAPPTAPIPYFAQRSARNRREAAGEQHSFGHSGLGHSSPTRCLKPSPDNLTCVLRS